MSADGARVLCVSATAAEAAHVPSGLPVVITGIGKVAAASAVARALAARPEIDLVVNIGSCGALRGGLGGVHEVARVLNHDLSAEALRALGYDPQEWLDLEGGEADGIALATGDLFVTDPAVRDALAARAHLVDMEGYAVAWACREAGVACRLVKHVSDNADEGALDWVALVDRSAQALGAWLADNISPDRVR
ncbi:nucleosidase [Nocardioides sp. DS6]|uniref:Nucleosidase n=1 Tax=Nocardioides eburneus TaxID=3231482 RepID=A0ABV3SW16_9ACTN